MDKKKLIVLIIVILDIIIIGILGVYFFRNRVEVINHEVVFTYDELLKESSVELI